MGGRRREPLIPLWQRVGEEHSSRALKDEEGLPGTGSSLSSTASEGSGEGSAGPGRQVVERTIAHRKLWWFDFNRNIFCFTLICA